MNRTSLVAFGYNDYLGELPIARYSAKMDLCSDHTCHNDYLETLPIASYLTPEELPIASGYNYFD